MLNYNKLERNETISKLCNVGGDGLWRRLDWLCVIVTICRRSSDLRYYRIKTCSRRGLSTRWQARGVWHHLAYAHTLHIKGYYFALGQFQAC